MTCCLLAQHQRLVVSEECHALETQLLIGLQRTFRRADLLKRHHATHSARTKRQQSALACDRCRYSKIKCDGGKPCQKCSIRSHPCNYSSGRIFLPDSTGNEVEQASEIVPSTQPAQGDAEDVLDCSDDPPQAHTGDSHHPVEEQQQETSAPTPYHQQRRQDSAMTALSIYKFPEKAGNLSKHEEQIRLASLLSFNVASLCHNAPLASLSILPANNTEVFKVSDQLVDRVTTWAREPQAMRSVNFACILHSLVMMLVDRNLEGSTALSELALSCLQDSALVIWVYAGFHSTSSPDTPVLQRTQDNGGDLPVCQGNAYELLMELALLCKKINSDTPSSRSKSIWTMAVNPFAEFLHLRESGDKPMGA